MTDPDLGIVIPVAKPIVVVNPKSAPNTAQVDFAFTFEKGPSDYVVLDDGVFGVAPFSDDNLYGDEFGNSQGFTADTFDDMLARLDAYIRDAKFWNARHRATLTARKISMGNYFFGNAPLNGSVLYQGLYSQLGMSEDGSLQSTSEGGSD